ncbi:ATP synthase F1 subunit gamma [Mycoplasma iguanae]|uniref:ATP synthase gamma chain n=1 Tax=Mycoplasma iguanae TaxID=292461 RepID=A0ABY5RBY7_9MOLU|nr:ATP synthase F1 subunit gamma [Mycoplasma iguanae]UVD81852.1 ATP synthase F1 subunit gamma [Mycoplasma iguanae]
MASLQSIKSRISSIETTRKITKAMELVSSAKTRKIKMYHESIQEYVQAIAQVLGSIYQKNNAKDLDLDINVTAGQLYVIVTSQLGLCGPYNLNIAKLAKKLVTKNDYVIILGSKGISILRETFLEEQVLFKVAKYEHDDLTKALEQIKNIIVNYLNDKKISAVNVLYTQYINSLTFQAINKEIFPLKANDFTNNLLAGELELEPNAQKILKSVLPLYFSSTLLNLIIESKVSEMSSRMSAMKSATNNADEINRTLKLLFNKSRQSNITQEITEIINGALND